MLISKSCLLACDSMIMQMSLNKSEALLKIMTKMRHLFSSSDLVDKFNI